MAIEYTKTDVIVADSGGDGSGVTENIISGVALAVFRQYLLRLAFTSGSEEPQARQTLSGATSGATGEVVDVVVTGGTWAGGDAAGNIYILNQTGTFEAENLDNDDTLSANVATIAADSVACAAMTFAITADNDLADPILSMASDNTSGWKNARIPVHDADDGSELVGQSDYQSLNNRAKAVISGAAEFDGARFFVKYDDLQG